VLREIDFLFKKFADRFNCAAFLETIANNRFESSQNHESRAQSADFSKTCNKPTAFNCCISKVAHCIRKVVL